MTKILKHPPKLSKYSAILLAVAAFVLSTSSAFAQAQCLTITTWSGGTGSWFTAANWTNGVPTSSINAQVNNGGTAQINSALQVANACSLTVGSSTGNSGNVLVDATTGGGTLNVTNSVVVAKGVLTLTNGGTVNAGGLTVSSSSTLEYNVIPAAAGKVNVGSGTATLTGSTLKVTMTGTFTAGTVYTLVTAGSRTGTFSTISISYPHGQGWTPQINYLGGNVYLTLVACSGCS
jgi:hypothetical protein